MWLQGAFPFDGSCPRTHVGLKPGSGPKGTPAVAGLPAHLNSMFENGVNSMFLPYETRNALVALAWKLIASRGLTWVGRVTSDPIGGPAISRKSPAESFASDRLLAAA